MVLWSVVYYVITKSLWLVFRHVPSLGTLSFVYSPQDTHEIERQVSQRSGACPSPFELFRVRFFFFLFFFDGVVKKSLSWQTTCLPRPCWPICTLFLHHSICILMVFGSLRWGPINGFFLLLFTGMFLNILLQVSS